MLVFHTVPCVASAAFSCLHGSGLVEEVGGRLQDVELYTEWEKCQVVAVSLQQRELPPHRGLSPALHGGFSFSSMGRGSCTARASWTSVLLGPLVLVEAREHSCCSPRSLCCSWSMGSAFPSHFHAHELHERARGANCHTSMGDWGGAEWSEQTNRVWDLHGGIQEPLA